MRKKKLLVFTIIMMGLIIFLFNLPSDGVVETEKQSSEKANSASNYQEDDSGDESKPVKKEVQEKLTISELKTGYEGRGEYYHLQFTSTVMNHTNKFIESAIVKFYLLDKNGNVLRSINSYVEDIPANGKRTAKGSCYDLDNLNKDGMKATAEVEKFGW